MGPSSPTGRCGASWFHDATPCPLAQSMSAMRRLDKARTKSGKNATDNFYANHLVLRSQPVEQCLRSIRRWPLPITSINEGRLLLALGVSEADRHQIEGLKLRRGLPGAADLPGAQAL
eukprot:6734701-Prymnesium_polylepis.1